MLGCLFGSVLPLKAMMAVAEVNIMLVEIAAYCEEAVVEVRVMIDKKG